MITESMAEALVHVAFDSLGDLVERGIEARRESACWREQKWRALIELTNAWRIKQRKRPRRQPLRTIYMIHAASQCIANKETCQHISEAVTRKLAEAKDRIAKGDFPGQSRAT